MRTINFEKQYLTIGDAILYKVEKSEVENVFKGNVYDVYMPTESKETMARVSVLNDLGVCLDGVSFIIIKDEAFNLLVEQRTAHFLKTGSIINSPTKEELEENLEWDKWLKIRSCLGLEKNQDVADLVGVTLPAVARMQTHKRINNWIRVAIELYEKNNKKI